MFEELCAPLWERLRTCVRQLLHDTRARDVDSVEMVGGASRMCMVKQLLTELTGTEPMTTMNMDDSVARGAAMQCAMLSPTFRVREFSVLDSYPYRIQIRFPVGLDKECR
jgi:molecular chaperone DnaK (HSP70)